MLEQNTTAFAIKFRTEWILKYCDTIKKECGKYFTRYILEGKEWNVHIVFQENSVI